MKNWKQRLEETFLYQMNSFFPTDEIDCKQELNIVLNAAIESSRNCIQGFRLSKWGGNNQDEMIVRPLHSIEYCIFLYWTSHYLYKLGKNELAMKVYYLNKALNCVELYYEVELPGIWSCEHPLGTIMGKAKYSDYFFFYQGCTVGGNFRRDGSLVYPVFETHVKMLSDSKVIGNCHIGRNVIISANTYIKDEDVPDNVIVFGRTPNLSFKKNYFANGCEVDNVLSK